MKLNSEQEKKALLFICFFGGGLMDFLFNGVFKIVWIAIYGPAYIAAAVGLTNSLHNSRMSKYAQAASLSLLAGAIVVHLLFTGHSRQITYQMNVETLSPMTFVSPAWPQKLIVSSDPLATKLAGSPAPVDIVILETLDYGCVQTFAVDSVGGVDVRLDSAASWVWKQPKNSDAEPAGPGQEDRVLPWCRLQFYRKS